MISKAKFINTEIQPFMRAKSNSKKDLDENRKRIDKKRVELSEQWDEMFRNSGESTRGMDIDPEEVQEMINEAVKAGTTEVKKMIDVGVKEATKDVGTGLDPKKVEGMIKTAVNAAVKDSEKGINKILSVFNDRIKELEKANKAKQG